jgi:hypothetical protein
MKKFLAFTVFVAMLASCKKTPDRGHNQGADGTDYTSIRQYDVNGVYLGNKGDAVDDYQQENWPQWVFDGFKPLDTTSLVGYMQSEVSVDRLYPNPYSDTQTFKYFAIKPANLKIMIVDENRRIVFLQSRSLNNASNVIGFNYSQTTMMPGNYYRMFYGVSAENSPFFLRGHIDIYKSN